MLGDAPDRLPTFGRLICSRCQEGAACGERLCVAWNAVSEREENCETTIAVEIAATSANAAPSHQRTP